MLVAVGDEVKAGQGVAVVEAMKMENELRSPKDGKVKSVSAKDGQAVEAGQALVTVE
jgi:biotin carboxyl carrier protein